MGGSESGEQRNPEPSSEIRDLFAKFVELEEQGEGPDFEAWVAGQRDHEAELRQLHGDWQALAGHPFFRRDRRQSAKPSVARPGDVIDDFRLIESIDSGGQGEVWRAEQLSLGREVALKILLPDSPRSKRQLQRFLREAEAGGRINHPGIVTVFMVGRDPDRPYIVQELVRGGCTLATFLAEMRDEQRLTSDYFPRVAALMIEVLEAVQAAHDAGVIHRDLKPQNILITSDDRPKVADFGLARVVDAESISRTGEFAGTYCYMSPEQATSRRMGIDERTDVFSAGSTLYELLTFHRAFDGDTTHQVTEKVIYHDPPDPRVFRSRIPRDLTVICAKAMEKRRGDRYQSMREFADDLGRYLRNEPILAKPAGPFRRAQKWARRHPTVASSVGVGALALVVIAGLVTRNISTLEAKTRAERDNLYVQAQWAIEMDDLDEALALIEEAGALDPDDPTGHLILAQGFRKYTRAPEALEQIELARSKGLHLTPGELESAMDHVAYGFFLLSERDHKRYPEIEAHLLRALELDKNLYHLNYTLYWLRTGVEDREGAREALAAYQARLATGEVFYDIVAAKMLALEDDYAGAAAKLESIARRPDIDEERLVELRYHRELGRTLLRTGDLDRAEQLLLRAVKDAPSDCTSWAVLSELYMKRHDRLSASPDRDYSRRAALLAEAEQAAEKAVACFPAKAEVYALRANAAVKRFGLEAPAANPDQNEHFVRALGHLQSLREVAPESAELTLLESELRFFEGYDLHTRGESSRAIRSFELSLEYDPTNVKSRALLGQALWFEDDHERALEELELALETWDDPRNADRWGREWLQVALVWIYGSAIRIDEPAAASKANAAKVRMLPELDRSPPIEELLSFAEFLADAPVELRDCDLARRLVEEFDLRTRFMGDAQEDAARACVELIDRNCPG